MPPPCRTARARPCRAAPAAIEPSAGPGGSPAQQLPLRAPVRGAGCFPPPSEPARWRAVLPQRRARAGSVLPTAPPSCRAGAAGVLSLFRRLKLLCSLFFEASPFLCGLVLLILMCSLQVNVGEDCPVFDGLFEFCQLSAGGSVGKLSIVCSSKRMCIKLFCLRKWFVGGGGAL